MKVDDIQTSSGLAEPATPAEHPEDPAAAAWKAGNYNKALALWQGILKERPDDLPAMLGYLRYGFAKHDADRAFRQLQLLLNQHPAEFAIWEELARWQAIKDNFRGVVETLNTAISDSRVGPATPEALGQLVQAYFSLGEIEKAAAAMEDKLERFPASAKEISALLFIYNYLQFESPEAEYAAIRKWADRAFGPETPPKSHDLPIENRPLRVGYVSPDFRWHAVAHFARPVIEAHDPAAVELFLYAEYRQADLNTLAFNRAAAHWIPTKDLDDDALCARIREDGIDVLVDLAGHSAHNRLGVFARRAAPVQISWLGYCNTTGLAAIDYRLSDAIVEPPAGVADRHSAEAIVRLPHGFHCFLPPDPSPPVAPPPALRAGHVTFGSFNNAKKHNHRTLALWARVLKACPNSHLLLKSGEYAKASLRCATHRFFSECGIDTQRIEFLHTTRSTSAHYESYGHIDIALDPFPYNGTTTTCDALWMGVPLITLTGQSHRARVGTSLLTRVGRSEWIADDEEAFVAIACRLASDTEALASERRALREAMQNSPLLDPALLARSLEKTFIDTVRQ